MKGMIIFGKAAISGVRTSVFRFPTPTPEADGTFAWNATTAVTVEVEAGDFMWLRAFCPQACYAGGPGRFRYLLYKDVNRHMPLGRLFG